MPRLNPYSVDDLLKVHGVMRRGLIPEAGRFRSGNVGVFGDDTLIHVGTPAKYVSQVMSGMFA